ncbi:putative ABC transporter ATP-binding protein [Luteitalea pratensis]|uniref:Putative ABC transporter ATP-binding protein n=1 Tax=Luteitalea pratensis TaxID=1855912 RepID=A0A143PM96_LUTPR|nr:ABC transporter ATP-binding protein [Luteitalea pratensis]AMY09621.1 putative ABC transporter ATP-binding protein [Luteitalea pratensis]
MSAHDDEILGKAYDSRLMRRLMGYLRPYKVRAAFALVAIVAGVAFSLAQPVLVKRAIDQYIASGDLAGVGTVALLYLGTLVGAFVAEFVQTTTLQMLGQRIMYDMRRQVFDHLQRLDLAYYDRNPVGRLMTRVTSDVDAINDLFTSGVVSVFGDVLSLLGIIVVLVSLDWRLALLTFCVLPLILMVTQWFRRNVRESYREVRTWVARLNAFLQENLTGMSTVQLFRREERAFADFDHVNSEHRDANLRSIYYYAVFYPAIELIGALSTALIVWFGGGWVLTGTLTIGTLVAFIQYAQRFFRPISDMSEKFNLLQAAMASSERLFGLLDTPVIITDPSLALGAEPALGPGPSAFEKPRGADSTADGRRPMADNAKRSRGAGRLVVEDVSFAYTPGVEVLKHVSFTVEPGQRIGIVGATGSGKSTLINLLLRFYDVGSGRILLDGRDIRELPLAQLRSHFALVLQDVYLFSGTIAGNIRLGRPDIDDSRVHEAAEAVHAAAFIRDLPHGYDTPVAERGATLSVGQKQLLSFARALAFDPQILVLDEATSSVDTETEMLIRDALHVLMEGRTTIAIAHRLSTIQDMDQILVLHRGELREAGTHQELLALRGIYHRLYQLQYQSHAPAATLQHSHGDA